MVWEPREGRMVLCLLLAGLDWGSKALATLCERWSV